MTSVNQMKQKWAIFKNKNENENDVKCKNEPDKLFL